jgi:hypothetical protein
LHGGLLVIKTAYANQPAEEEVADGMTDEISLRLFSRIETVQW